VNLWLVGQYKCGEFPDIVWEFQGVFDTEAAARDACICSTYFYAPVELNHACDHECIEFPNVKWPRVSQCR